MGGVLTPLTPSSVRHWMMTHAQTDQDIEWKFVRSKLYMEYIRQGSPLPVPFNIIPTPHSALLLIAGTFRRWRHWQRDRSDEAETCSPSSGVDEENSPIYRPTTRPNGAATNATNIPMWQVETVLRLVQCDRLDQEAYRLPSA